MQCVWLVTCTDAIVSVYHRCPAICVMRSMYSHWKSTSVMSQTFSEGGMQFKGYFSLLTYFSGDNVFLFIHLFRGKGVFYKIDVLNYGEPKTSDHLYNNLNFMN